MKTFAALAMLVLVAHAAEARSWGSGTAIGDLDESNSASSYSRNRRPNQRRHVASAKDLDRAKTMAEKARERTGSTGRRSSWAYGGK